MSEVAVTPGRDDVTFGELISAHTRELHVHCYRLLGSASDADDVLQETWLAAWRGLSSFTGRSSVRAWLYRIATNRCLNFVRDGRRRPRLLSAPPFEPPAPTHRGDVPWLQPYPDVWRDAAADPAANPAAKAESDETIRLAFVTALQRMPPRQAAALVLCDVLDFSRAEVAAMLDVTDTAIKGLVQRAHAALDRDAPAVPPVSPGDDDVAQRFATAYAADDVDAVVALLTDDAWLAMPPAPHEYHGSGAIAGFLHASAVGRAGRHVTLQPCGANGQPAFACWLRFPGERRPRPAGVVVVTVESRGIKGVTRFLGAVPAPFHAGGPTSAPHLAGSDLA